MQSASAKWIEYQEDIDINLPESFIEITLHLPGGTTQVFTKTNLIRYEHSMEVDLLSGRIPVNKISWAMDNTDGEWNPLKPQSYAKYLAESSKVTVRYGMNVDGTTEWIHGGVFYLSDWNTPANGFEVSFDASDVFSFMTDAYTGPRKGSLYSIIAAAFDQAALPNGDTIQYSIDTSLNAVYTDFSSDSTEYTRAEIVQLGANAGCAIMRYDRLGAANIEPMSETKQNYTIDLDRSYAYPEYGLSQKIKDIWVYYKNGTAIASGQLAGNVQTVNNALITSRSNALKVARWASKTLVGRKTLKGSFRADIRLDAFDRVDVEHQDKSESTVAITSLKYIFTGAWRGEWEGRIIEQYPANGYAGETYSMASGDIIFTQRAV